MKITIDGTALHDAFDLADEWNQPDGTTAKLCEYIARRTDFEDSVIQQQIVAGEADPDRDDSKDAEQWETVVNALAAYISGEATGKRPSRSQVMREIRASGITITRRNRYSDDSACVCCGAEVPEGRQVCKKCENEKGD